jgi:phage baseplate assembly protein W
MSKDFLGRGWRFPVQVTDDGSIALSEYEQDIREAILIILGTALGERIMRPEYGAGMHKHVFASMNTTTISLVSFEVREALIAWEPRIEVLKVEVSIADAAQGKLSVFIEYKVRSTNTVFNLVYPFYLTGTEA